VIDADGFRPNVGIILTNSEGRVFWARRVRGHSSWQFPQGGIRTDELPEEALYRELGEEVGLNPEHVVIMGATRGWLRYRLPRRYRRNTKPLCIGQKQVWFLLRLRCDERQVRLDASDTPEFDRWQWVDYWRPLDEVIFFKRHVYARALDELAPLLFT
jgi:putative (di)nucleoside polyphosphate hydrolase